MLLLGLTGSIGMGKSQTLKALRGLMRGAAFYDADAAVHQLYNDPRVVDVIRKAFPAAGDKGGIDRKKLGSIIFKDTAANKKLGDIIYPRLAALELQALQAAARRRVKTMVLDVPLLYETNADDRVDMAMLVSAPAFVQRARVLARPGMDNARFQSINSTQMSDCAKRELADFIVPTGLGRAHTLRHLQKLLRKTKLLPGRRWQSLIYLKEFYARNRS